MLIDRFGRPLKKLRVSVTQRCNFRCFFCHREGISRDSSIELSPEDLGFVARTLSKVGIEEAKLTGGEPLVRSDIVEIVQEMSDYMRVSMTTNGFLLKRYAKALKEAGLERVNVSLHGLDDESFRYVTRVEVPYDIIIEAIKEASRYFEVKLNVVMLSSNIKHIPRYIELAERYGINLQFIELLGNSYPQKVNPIEVEKFVARRARGYFIRKDMQNRIVYILRNGVKVEFVKPENASFCRGCTRIRLSHDGRFMPCLRLPIAIDALEAIKARDEKLLLERLKEAVISRIPFVRPERIHRLRSVLLLSHLLYTPPRLCVERAR